MSYIHLLVVPFCCLLLAAVMEREQLELSSYNMAAYQQEEIHNAYPSSLLVVQIVEVGMKGNDMGPQGQPLGLGQSLMVGAVQQNGPMVKSEEFFTQLSVGSTLQNMRITF